MIGYLACELSDEKWKRMADRMMDAMFDEGVLPARSRLSGGESAILAFEQNRNDGPDWGAVGMAVVYQPEGQDLLWLDLLYVIPSHRRAGIGLHLAHEAIRLADERGLPAIEVGTMLFNAAMIGLAQKAGFGEATVYFRQEVG